MNNQQYTLSYDWTVISISSGERIFSGLGFYYEDGERHDTVVASIDGALGDSGHKTIVSYENKTIDSVASNGWGYSGKFRLSNIQIEEGTKATGYEPYISEPVTDIVISPGATGNRTYTANWIEN